MTNKSCTDKNENSSFDLFILSTILLKTGFSLSGYIFDKVNYN